MERARQILAARKGASGVQPTLTPEALQANLRQADGDGAGAATDAGAHARERRRARAARVLGQGAELPAVDAPSQAPEGQPQIPEMTPDVAAPVTEALPLAEGSGQQEQAPAGDAQPATADAPPTLDDALRGPIEQPGAAARVEAAPTVETVPAPAGERDAFSRLKRAGGAGEAGESTKGQRRNAPKATTVLTPSKTRRLPETDESRADGGDTLAEEDGSEGQQNQALASWRPPRARQPQAC